MKDQISQVIKKDRSFVYPMEEVRILARHTSNPEQLLELSKRYCNDFETCKYLINNSNLTESAKYELALSKDVEVRRLLAQRGEKINSTKTQLRLAMDSDKIVKENLARTTTNEEIKELLFKSCPENKSNESIRKYCLKRMRDMDIIERFLLTSPYEILAKYVDSILSNKHLSTRLLNLAVTVSGDLTESQKKLVEDHPHYNPVHINLP